MAINYTKIHFVKIKHIQNVTIMSVNYEITVFIKFKWWII